MAATGLKVIEVQPTPNPNAMKFVLDRAAFDPAMSFFAAEQAAGHPLAERLFAIEGVSSLLMLGDFVTVNKVPSARWSAIQRQVKRAIEQA